MRYRLPLEISHEDGLWMARSADIQGFLVTGTTLDQLFADLPIVSQALFETCQAQGWSFVKGRSDIVPSELVR